MDKYYYEKIHANKLTRVKLFLHLISQTNKFYSTFSTYFLCEIAPLLIIPPILGHPVKIILQLILVYFVKYSRVYILKQIRIYVYL